MIAIAALSSDFDVIMSSAGGAAHCGAVLPPLVYPCATFALPTCIHALAELGRSPHLDMTSERPHGRTAEQINHLELDGYLLFELPEPLNHE